MTATEKERQTWNSFLRAKQEAYVARLTRAKKVCVKLRSRVEF